MLVRNYARNIHMLRLVCSAPAFCRLFYEESRKMGSWRSLQMRSCLSKCSRKVNAAPLRRVLIYTQPDTEVSTAPHRSFVFLSSRWEKRTSRQRIQLIGGVVQAGIVKHPNPLNDKAFEGSWGQGTREIYRATNSCMDLKSKCNHYRWESLDVTKSSYLEPFKSWLADRCFKQRNKSLHNWRPTSSCTTDRESKLCWCIYLFHLLWFLLTHFPNLLI